MLWREPGKLPKYQSIAQEMLALQDFTFWGQELHCLDVGMRRRVMHCIIVMTNRMLANYDRRVTRRFETVPVSLLWFGFGEGDDPCEEKKNLATAIINNTPETAIQPQRS